MKKSFIKYLVKLFGFHLTEIFAENKRNNLTELKQKHNFSVGDSVTFGEGMSFNLKKDLTGIIIGSSVVFRNFCSIYLHRLSTLTIGDHVFFNNYCSINCMGEVVIGENTMFGEAVRIYDHNHKYEYTLENTLKIERDDFKIGFVRIGKNCWIGSNVTILNNVEIGDNVIVGANCLIYKSIPSNTIVKCVDKLEILSR